MGEGEGEGVVAENTLQNENTEGAIMAESLE
jgi:hypothetical protein